MTVTRNFALFTAQIKFNPFAEQFFGTAGRFGNPASNWGFVIDKVGTPPVNYVPSPLLQTASATDFKMFFANVVEFWKGWINSGAWGESALKVNYQNQTLEFYLDYDYFKGALGIDIIADKLFANIWSTTNDQSLSVVVSNPEKTSLCTKEF